MADSCCAPRRLRILFLCTGNSCRSQMAEGFARALRSDALEAHSAGTRPKGLDPRAVRAMAEVGVDLSGQRSKSIAELEGRFDVVVTVCGDAHETCPVVPGARVIHVAFDDPPRLAKDATSDGEALPHYRRVRDEIRRFVESLPGALDPTERTAATAVERTTMNPSRSTSCCPGTAADALTAGSPCGPAPSAETPDEIRERVREGYAELAKSGSFAAEGATTDGGACGSGGCCGPTSITPESLAAALGYGQDELAATPTGANLGLSCGNPTALASLRAGEVVLDLGAGGGFDVFVAGKKVGPSGRVIGVDMTPEMIARARKNSAAYRARTGFDNVEFRLGEIEHLPVGDASVDVVISNCVLNLSPAKARVWQEIARVLKPGGRVAVSDLALLRPLPEAVRKDVQALVGCVAGAELVETTRARMAAAGLVDVAFVPKAGYVAVMTSTSDPLYESVRRALPPGTTPADFVTSLDIAAKKPVRGPR